MLTFHKDLHCLCFFFFFAKGGGELPLDRLSLWQWCKITNLFNQNFARRYAIDVISSCAFGLRTDSLRNPDSEFRRMGKKTFEMNTKLVIRNVLFAFNPRVGNSLGIKSISDEVNDFFVNLVRDTVTYRKQNGIERDDFLNQIMRLENEPLGNDSKGNEKSIDIGTYERGVLQKFCIAQPFSACGNTVAPKLSACYWWYSKHTCEVS